MIGLALKASAQGRAPTALGLGVLLLFLIVFLLAPIATVLTKSFQTASGGLGFANYAVYFSSASLARSVGNSLWVAGLTTIVCVPLAFGFSYCLTHTCLRGKAIFRAIALLPILAPSLLPALALIYLFGRQGILRGWFFGGDLYGPQGIVIAQVFYCFPHAVLILSTAMSTTDTRLYEASECLGASRWLTFFRVTLPSCRYGLLSACFVVFTLVTTDFGVPKIIGGNFSVLSTDIYKQVIGQQNFEMGAVVGVVLLTPTLIAFALDRIVQRRHVAVFSSRSVVHVPKRSAIDAYAFIFCMILAAAILAIFFVAAWGSFVRYWPYDLSLTLANYQFSDFDSLGWDPYFNSIHLAIFVALFGTWIVFAGAYLAEKSTGFVALRAAIQFLAVTPVAVPGLVLGLGYIFFFNNPRNPMSVLFGSLAVLVVNTVIHFYTVPHLTCVSALKQLDREFELISDSLRATRFMIFKRVTTPLCSIVILDVAGYFFVNAMTTVAAVIFLYSADNKPAAVAAIGMDDSGMPAAAMAMGMMIVYTSLGVRVIQTLLARSLIRRTQRWRAGDKRVAIRRSKAALQWS